MYAIVDIAGKQFKVAKDQYIYAPKMDGEAGAAVSFDKVLLVDDGGNVQIGAPAKPIKGTRPLSSLLVSRIASTTYCSSLPSDT